jgi:hypothetical protein
MATVDTKPRNTYKYHFIVGGKIVYRGVTSNLDFRRDEHLKRWPSGHLVQIGRRTTMAKAVEWMRRGPHAD